LLWKQLSAIPIELIVEMSMQQIAANTWFIYISGWRIQPLW
jgi:hypothetical protein